MKETSGYIKKSQASTPSDALSKFLLSSEQSDTDYSKTFNALVVDNDESSITKSDERLGRCKVRIFGIHGDDKTGVQDEHLPWALPDFGFIGGSKGSFIVPPDKMHDNVETIVSVYFEDGDRYLPRYTRKVVDSKNMPTDLEEDYPNNMIFYETDNGDKFMINRKKKTTTLKHSSGTTITIEANGKLMIDHVGEWEVSKSTCDNIAKPETAVPGPFCGLPYCMYTGGIHQSNITKFPPPPPPTGV